MKTTKINKEEITKKVNKALETAKENAKKVNDYALNTTEEVVTESISMVSEWQKVADKALKGGIHLLNNQQNLIFDALETYKEQFVNGRKRFRKVFTS